MKKLRATDDVAVEATGNTRLFYDAVEPHVARVVVVATNQFRVIAHSGRIHKQGSKLGGTALVQSALIAANYSPYLKNFYERVKARRGAGRATIALARKFLGITYRTLKQKWVFEGFPNLFWRRAHDTALGSPCRNPGLWYPLRRPSFAREMAERCSALRVR